MSRRLYVLCVVIAIAPLPLASVSPVAWSGIAFFVGLLVVSTSISMVLARSRQPALGWQVLLPFIAVVVWIFLQQTSLMESWHNRLWNETSLALGEPMSGAISLDRTAGMTNVLHLLTYAGVIYLAVYYGRDRASTVFGLIAVSGFAYALYGIIEFASGNEHVLWFRKTAYLESLTGTFINRNSFATYLGLSILCTTGLIGCSISAAAPMRRILLAIILFTQCIALFLTGSRGGVVSTLIGVAFVAVVMLTGRKITQRQRLVFAAALIVAVGTAFSQSGDLLLERLQNGTLDRGPVLRLTSELIEQNPLTGTGYGTFEDVFRMHRDSSIVGNYDMAHNTYLEEALELGIPATGLLLISLGWVVVLCLRGLSHRNADRMMCGIGAAAVVLVGVHALVDFSLQIPAVALTFCLILGTATAQSKQS